MSATASIALHDGKVMPRLGFGLWQVPPEIAEDVTGYALKAGYRSIDTARAYFNEVGVGRALAASGLAREEVFVTTKLWNDDQGYSRTLKSFDESLHRLGLDQVDLYLMHWPSQSRDLYVETWKAFIRLHKDGRAKSIGVSNFAIPHLQRLFDETGVVPVVNQVELHPLFQQRGLRTFHQQHGIVTESWSPLGRGAILDLPVITRIARKHQRTPAQIIIRWHLENNLVVIPKSVTPSRILENAQVFDFQLDVEDHAALASLDRVNGRMGPEPETALF
ncbi:MAG: aldo/keto reductase [Caulobacter sp.]|nr:aldo/keto reductase [Caulobacter sp.]